VKTRAVLLNRTGSVHRVVIGSDGADMTACGEQYTRHVQVTPKQALVYRLGECHGPLCWGPGMWSHFLEDAS
jgi:hypothetical protein